MAVGDISGTIAQLDFDEYGGSLPKLIHISGTTYAVAYSGYGNDGYLKTITVNDDGTIGGVIQSLEFDSSNGRTPWIIHIAGNVYAIAYVGPGSNGSLKTFTIDADGTIGTIASDVFDAGTGLIEPMIVHISGTTYAIVYGGPGSDGWLKTVTINDNGTIGGVIQSLEFDSTHGTYGHLLHISGTIWAIAYTAVGINGPGRIITLPIANDGTIGAIEDTSDYDTNQTGPPFLFHVAGTKYGVAYGGPGFAGWLRTITIADDGTIGSLIRSLVFDTSYAKNCWVVEIGENVWAISYDGPDGDGWLKTIKINDDGTIAGQVDYFEFDTTGAYSSMIKVSTNVYAIAYLGPGNDGWLKTIGLTELPDRIYVFLQPANIELTAPSYPTVLACHIERGEDAELAEATTGVCQLTCDNHNGDFSPENVAGQYYPDLQIGMVIEVFEIFGGVRYDIFKGRIDNIDPLAEKGDPYAYINVLDGMDDMKGTEVSTALRTNTDSGTLVDDVLTAVAWAAGDRELDAGVDVLQLGWFHKIDALAAIRVLERVENGRFFVSPAGIATWHNRHHRLTGNGLVSQYDFAEKSIELDYEYTKRLVKNVINLRGRRYYAGGGATLFSGYDLATIESDLIWSAHAGDAGAPYVPQQTSLTLWADMNAPLAAYDTLVKGTHWNANTEPDKSGVDVSADVTLVQTQYGQSVKMVFTNAGSVGAYLVVPDTPPLGAPDNRTVLVYGTLYGEEVMAISEEDATSQTDYGKRSMALDLPFKSNPNDILSYAQYLKRKYKDAVPRAVSVKIAHRTDWPDTSIKIQCLTREIGDRITLASSRLGFDRDFYINKVVQDYAFNEGGFVAEATWYVERAAGTVEEIFWILGEVGFSEIGETTVLGF